MRKEAKSKRLFREGKIPYSQYVMMRVCELSGQKGYKGKAAFIISK